MKLSQISTDKAMDVLCELTPHITEILSDEELMEELKTAVDFNVEGCETLAGRLAMIGDKISKIIPILLKKKKYNLFSILGVLNEKTAEEISKQNFLITMKQIKEMSKDKELVNFFKSWTDMGESE